MFDLELECSTRNISQVFLPAGEASSNYQLTLCIGLTDRLGAESFSYAYSVVVTPVALSLIEFRTILNSSSSYFQWFDASGDLSEVSSFVLAFTASFNTLNDFAQLLDNSSSGNNGAASNAFSAATQSAALSVFIFIIVRRQILYNTCVQYTCNSIFNSLALAISTREMLMTGLAFVTSNYKFTSFSMVNQLTAAAAAVLSQPQQVSFSAASSALSLLDNIVPTVSTGALFTASTDPHTNRELIASQSNMLACMGLILDSTNLQGVPGSSPVGTGMTPLRSINTSMKAYLKRQAAVITSYITTIELGLLSKKVSGIV